MSGSMGMRKAGGRRRGLTAAGALLVLVALAGFAKAWSDTMAKPRAMRASLVLAALPPGTAPIRLAFIADTQVAGPDMPPARLARIVERINALRPDLVLLGGDFVDDKAVATRHYTAAEAIAPLGGLRPAIASVAVPGNHDHWRDIDAVRRALAANGIVVLENTARRFGPLTVGGLDDEDTGHADVAALLRWMDRLGGAGIVLTHSPDPFPRLPERVGLALAGHTHCGQIRYPWGGSPATMSRYGDLYACGMVREGGKVLITTAGIGTSMLPVRFGTQAEIWLIELRPPVQEAPAAG